MDALRVEPRSRIYKDKDSLEYEKGRDRGWCVFIVYCPIPIPLVVAYNLNALLRRMKGQESVNFWYIHLFGKRTIYAQPLLGKTN